MLKRWFLKQLRPKIIQWLDERALRIPSAQRLSIARVTGAPIETVDAVCDAVRAYAVSKVDELLSRL